MPHYDNARPKKNPPPPQTKDRRAFGYGPRLVVRAGSSSVLRTPVILSAAVDSGDRPAAGVITEGHMDVKEVGKKLVELCRFEVTADDVIAINNAHVSKEVVKAVMDESGPTVVRDDAGGGCRGADKARGQHP